MALLAALVTTNCGHGESQAGATPVPSSTPLEIAVGAGVRCAGSSPGDPVIYRIADLGKPGVPVPDMADGRLLAQIVRVDHLASKDVRFVYIAGQFVVFLREQGGLCESGTHHMVLNAWCDQFYEPGEEPGFPLPSAECWSTPPPWGWRMLRTPTPTPTAD